MEDRWILRSTASDYKYTCDMHWIPVFIFMGKKTTNLELGYYRIRTKNYRLISLTDEKLVQSWEDRHWFAIYLNSLGSKPRRLEGPFWYYVRCMRTLERDSLGTLINVHDRVLLSRLLYPQGLKLRAGLAISLCGLWAPAAPKQCPFKWRFELSMVLLSR